LPIDGARAGRDLRRTSVTRSQDAIREFTKAIRDVAGNLPPMPGVFPDYMAPAVRNAPDSVRELAKLRWGMPSSQIALMEATRKRAATLQAKGQSVDCKQLLRMEPDSGTTNIRNTSSKHWATLARRRTPLRCALHIVQRIQQSRRWRYLVCSL
jgi:putative SOS response-associated peptidase YedK